MDEFKITDEMHDMLRSVMTNEDIADYLYLYLRRDDRYMASVVLYDTPACFN